MLKILLAALVGIGLLGCTKKGDSNPNVLQLATTAKIKGMDPAGAQDVYSAIEISRVYETLLQYHPFKRPYELEPLLAAEMPTVSKNGLIYTFKIKPGIFFQDDSAFAGGKGRELKAIDFVYSLKRLADPRVQSTGWWVLDGRVKGLNAWRQKYADGKLPTNYDDEVAGLRALDDYTLQLELTQPYPQLAYAMAMPYTAAVAREAVEKYGPEFLNHAVGTGPFVVDSYNPNDLIVYKKNPNYWDSRFPSGAPGGEADAGKKLPFVDGVNVRIIVEEQPRWLHFLRGELDSASIPKDSFDKAVKAVDPSKPITHDNIALSSELTDKGIQFLADIGVDLTYTAFNLDSKEFPQLKDKRVRQAISLALDDKEALQLFYNGLATPAQTPIPPGMNGYDPGYVNPYRTGNLEKARELMAQAGFPGGKGFPVLPYDTVASTVNRQMADYAAKKLERIGVKLQVQSNTWPKLLERVQNRQTQFWGIAWLADYPDAESFLQLFYGPNAQPGGMNNSYYRNPEFDRMFEKARVMQDSPVRTELYRKLGRMVAEDVPVVLGVHRISLALRQPWIKYSMIDEFTFNRAKYIKIDLDAKKKYDQ